MYKYLEYNKQNHFHDTGSSSPQFTVTEWKRATRTYCKTSLFVLQWWKSAMGLEQHYKNRPKKNISKTHLICFYLCLCLCLLCVFHGIQFNTNEKLLEVFQGFPILRAHTNQTISLTLHEYLARQVRSFTPQQPLLWFKIQDQIPKEQYNPLDAVKFCV